jgi:predicted phosphodiesterase
MTSQAKISKALDRAFEEARQQAMIPLDPEKRYVIFSDHHKGARTGADDFQPCETAYMEALGYYFGEAYSLIVVGDVEELWEESAGTVLASYPAVFQQESDFYKQDRYLRVYGNHDNLWKFKKKVVTLLHGYFPDIRVQEGLVFEASVGGEKAGEIFLVHGHQGTFGSDEIAPISRFVVRLFWRAFQILTGKGRTTPAKDACLRARHDTQMYEWARRQPKLILIAGHTHRPVWSSMTHLQQLSLELDTLKQLPAAERPADYSTKVEQLQDEIRVREAKYPPCNDTIKTQPSYFNTGCCCFEDGDITGIELDAGQIRLVKWGSDNGTIARHCLRQSELTELFAAI